MTIEEWRNLQPDQLVTIANSSHIFKVCSTGWDDMEEEDYEDDRDYIIEVKDLFNQHYEENQFIVRAFQTEIYKSDIPTKILEMANEHDSPYEFLDGYFIGKETNNEIS